MKCSCCGLNKKLSLGVCDKCFQKTENSFYGNMLELCETNGNGYEEIK